MFKNIKSIKPLYKGIVLMIVSAFCFAIMNMSVQLSGELPPIQKSFFRNFIALILACGILIKDHKDIKIPKNSWLPLILRAGFGTLGILCNFYALGILDLADASMLNKMSPFFAIIFSIFILKEKIKPVQFFIVFGAFIGAMCVVKPNLANAETIPSLIALFGGMCAGIAYTFVRKLGQQGVKGSVIVCFFSAFSCIVTLPYITLNFQPMELKQVLFLLLAGLSAAGGQFSITSAYCYAPAKKVSVYDYSQIIFAAALGFIVFGQIPDLLSWIGYFIICTMAVIMFIYNKKSDEKQKIEEEYFMKKIASFTINHDTLTEGIYTSRIDSDIITYDIRMRKPNNGDYLDTDALHTVEHLFATYVRNSKYSDDIIYFGPMGCRTGCYFIVRNNISPDEVIQLVKSAFNFIKDFEGEIPGSKKAECGNYLDHNLEKAKLEGKMMCDILKDWTINDLKYKD